MVKLVWLLQTWVAYLIRLPTDLIYPRVYFIVPLTFYLLRKARERISLAPGQQNPAINIWSAPSINIYYFIGWFSQYPQSPCRTTLRLQHSITHSERDLDLWRWLRCSVLSVCCTLQMMCGAKSRRFLLWHNGRGLLNFQLFIWNTTTGTQEQPHCIWWLSCVKFSRKPWTRLSVFQLKYMKRMLCSDTCKI